MADRLDPTRTTTPSVPPENVTTNAPRYETTSVRQGGIGWPVLIVLAAGIILALLVWAPAEWWGRTTEPDARQAGETSATTNDTTTPAPAPDAATPPAASAPAAPAPDAAPATPDTTTPDATTGGTSTAPAAPAPATPAPSTGGTTTAP